MVDTTVVPHPHPGRELFKASLVPRHRHGRGSAVNAAAQPATIGNKKATKFGEETTERGKKVV